MVLLDSTLSRIYCFYKMLCCRELYFSNTQCCMQAYVPRCVCSTLPMWCWKSCSVWLSLDGSSQAVVLALASLPMQGHDSTICVDFNVSHQGDYAVLAGQEDCIGEWVSWWSCDFELHCQLLVMWFGVALVSWWLCDLELHLSADGYVT